MAEEILMPRLSDTMTEGVIASWHKKVGDPVKKGEVLAEIETDKATMELESYKDGKLLYQGAKPGEKIQVNDLLAIIGKEGLNVEEIVNGIKVQAARAILMQARWIARRKMQQTHKKRKAMLHQPTRKCRMGKAFSRNRLPMEHLYRHNKVLMAEEYLLRH